MSRKGIKHKSVETTTKGITYVKGVNVGYDITVGNLALDNVGFRSLRDVYRQLQEKGYKRMDISKKRHERKREKV
jgi:hypothetical protein